MGSNYFCILHQQTGPYKAGELYVFTAQY